MALDLENSYKEINEKSKSYATYKQVRDDIIQLKKNTSNNLDSFNQKTVVGINDRGENSNKRYQQQTKNQFERLIDIAKFNPSDKGSSATVNYIKRALTQTATRSGSKITKLVQDEMIKALGCSEQEEYIPNTEVIVPLWSIDLFKQLKQSPETKTGKVFYEKNDTQIGITPFSLNRSFYYSTQLLNANYFTTTFGTPYLGYSNLPLFDIRFSPNTPLPPPFNYLTDAYSVTLSGGRNGYRVSEFLSDYFRSINVFDSRNFFTQLIEILTAFISIELKTDLDERSKFLLFIERIFGLCFDFTEEINVSGTGKIPEFDVIDESFFELNDVDLRSIDERISNIRLGVVEFTDCNNIKLPVNTRALFELVDKLSSTENQNEEDEIINSLTNTLAKTPSWTSISDLDIKIDADILRNIPKALVLAILTPKVIFPFVVMSLALGKTMAYEITNLTEFLKKNIRLMVNLTSKIFAIFVKELYMIITKDLKLLVQVILLDLAKNRISKRYSIIFSLLQLILVISNLVSDYRRCKSVVDEILLLLSLATRNTPFTIPLPLVALSVLRSGFDDSRAFVNIIQEYQKLGLPTGAMPDGSPNLMIISKFAEIKGIQKEDNENGVVKVFLPPGASITGGITLSGIKA